MHYRGASTPKQLGHTHEEVELARLSLREKVAYLAHTHETVTLWNLDQTGLRVLPSAWRGWCNPGVERVRFVFDDKQMVTLLVATLTGGGELVGQIIFGT